jgi:hypothetical protein
MIVRFLSVESGESHVDSQAAAGWGLGGDGGVVRVGDRLHDREAEPDSVRSLAWTSAESLEGLEEAGELAGGDHGSGVRDREPGASSDGVRGDFEPAVPDVVIGGVGDQIRDEALEKLRVAADPGRFEGCSAPESVTVVGSQHFGRSGGEVDGLPPQTSALAAGEGEQRLEQSLLALASDNDALAHLAQRSRACVGVGECDLCKRALEGDLSTQLMGCVREETLLRFNRNRCSSDFGSHNPSEGHGTAIARAKEPRSPHAHQLGRSRF